MEEVIEKAFLKGAYLLQLRQRSFTPDELGQGLALGSGQVETVLRYLTSAELLGQDTSGRYTLLDSGRKKIKVVLTGGVYDLIHLGHLMALSEAKSYGDALVVVVATDATVERLKGHRPTLPTDDRCAIVGYLKPVDAAVPGYEDADTGYEQVIAEVKPDIIALGYDQDALAASIGRIVKEKKFTTRIVRLSKFHKAKYSSSSTIKQGIRQSTEQDKHTQKGL